MGAYLLNETSIGDIEEIVPVPHWCRGTSAWVLNWFGMIAEVGHRLNGGDFVTPIAASQYLGHLHAALWSGREAGPAG